MNKAKDILLEAERAVKQTFCRPESRR